MRLCIGAVGRLKDGPETNLFDRYKARIPQMGKALNIGPFSHFEIAEHKAKSADERKRQEGRQLLEKSPEGAYLLVLDEKGRQFTSAEFANFIKNQRLNAVPALSFLIGGPDGHSEEVKKSAQKTLSLSPMTLPHGLARVIIAEQIYRSLCILSGHPYHRE